MVEYGADTWNGEESKKHFTYLQNLPNSATHEETFLTGCLKPPGKAIRCRIKQGRRRRTTHGFLRKCQPPACQGIPVAERKDAVSGLKDGNHRADNAWARQQDRTTRRSLAFGRKPQCVAKQHESTGSHRLAIFATFPTAKVEVTRA